MSDWKATYHRILRQAATEIRDSVCSTDRPLVLLFRPSTDTSYARLYVRYMDVGVADDSDLQLVSPEAIPTNLTPDEMFQWIKDKTDWLPMLPLGANK